MEKFTINDKIKKFGVRRKQSIYTPYQQTCYGRKEIINGTTYSSKK